MEEENNTNVEEFIGLHRNQLIASGVPENFWPTLCQKLTQQIFDGGEAFSLLLIDYGDEEREEEDPLWTLVVSKEDGIKTTDSNAIYIIDHAWTFRLNTARAQLRQVPGLLHRMSLLMGVPEEQPAEENIDQVMHLLWKYCQMYAIGGNDVPIEERMPIWYIMDELGSGINHSDTPNFRVVPFVHAPEGMTYSIMFPIRDCDENEPVTRDFVDGQPENSPHRNALLLPWRYNDFTDIDFQQHEADADYFLAGHIEETLPDTAAPPPQLDLNGPLKVFTTYSMVKEHLNDPSFELVDNEQEADILWLTTHFKQYLEFSQQTPNRFVNQFPFENVITIKDLLSVVCRRTATKYYDEDTLATYPKWLPTTFNLKTELLEFISYYQQRQAKELDNHWIVKPWNLARGLDTHITKHLTPIMRLQPSGPKIAQKYIENPVLFERDDVDGKVKFDIRYVFLVKSVEPLEAYIYSNFFLRFSNKAFALTNFDDYEQHFTVMNYGSELTLRHIPCAEFLQLWAEQFPKHAWDDIETTICDMLKEMLLGATYKPPPCGIGKSPQSRALYAADIMLEWTDNDTQMQPKLLEVNYTPDCQRACQYYPDFFNDIFKLLFLDISNEEVFRKITP